MMQPFSLSHIGANFRRFFTGTLFSRLTGFGRELAMAALFGVSAEVAAFWMAFRFSQLLRRLFGEGGLHVAFVPHFELLRKEDTKRAYAFFTTLMVGLGALLITLALLAELILGGFILFASLSTDTQSLCQLLFLMMPSFIFISLYALNASFLQCEGSYFVAAQAPAWLNILWVASLPWLPTNSTIALERLAIIVVIGLCFNWLMTFIPVYRHLHTHLPDLYGNWKEQLRWNSAKKYLSILRPFSLALVGVAAVQINSALDAIFARFADAEGPAILWYALRLEQLPLALVGVGVSAAFFPPLARAQAQNEEGRQQYSELLFHAMSRTLSLLIPITIAIGVLSLSSVNFVYGRGAFTQEATRKTSLALIGYGIGLIPSTLVFVFASAFYAKKNYRLPTLASLFSVACNMAANAFFVFVLKWGAISIAFATSLAACVNMLILKRALFGQILPLPKGLLKISCKVTAASIVAAVAVLLVDH